MDPLVISLVSACTALVASIVGPLVTLTVARRQFNATVLSANRQKWIESLRDMLAELISLLVAVVVVKSKWHGEWNKGLGAIAADPTLMDKLERVVLVQWKIRLASILPKPIIRSFTGRSRRHSSACSRRNRVIPQRAQTSKTSRGCPNRSSKKSGSE